jgi:hypothetical protein
MKKGINLACLTITYLFKLIIINKTMELRNHQSKSSAASKEEPCTSQYWRGSIFLESGENRIGVLNLK